MHCSLFEAYCRSLMSEETAYISFYFKKHNIIAKIYRDFYLY